MSFLRRFSHIFTPGTSEGQQVSAQLPVQPSPKKVAKKPQLTSVGDTKALRQAQARAREIIVEAKDEAYQIRQKASQEVRDQQDAVQRLREETQRRQADLERQLGAAEEKDRLLDKREKQLEERFVEVEKVKQEQLEKLERVAGLTREEAKKLLLEATEKKLQSEMGRLVKESEEKAKEEAEDRSQEILIDAMYHAATDFVSEYTVSIVKLADEDMKGRVIGKEGRNIRTFEKVTGVDVDLDEEGVIRLSCFDPVRREIARVALEKLIRDGRIQPSRIEELVNKTREEIERVMYKAGEDLCHRLKVYNLPKPIIEMLGRFKYRFSYGQNMISHTLEESKIGIALAQEVGANINVVRLGCLLHDIGKVITDEEGSHVQVGANFLKKHGIPQSVVDCVAQHHEDEEFSSPEAVLVYIADAISGSRPGARYENYEEYVKRLTDLEEVAKSFDGVKEAYAIQAGREVRVIVDPEKRDDTATFKLAENIRNKVKKELTYPGQVKVTVIREVRHSEVAQ
jgi:ribonuclease Y